MPLHIVQRGHDRKAVFAANKDYQYYLDNLRERALELDVKVYGYCLMTNHVHLIVAPDEPAENIARLIKTVAARQTRYVNKLENRTGTLWEGRYKASLIDTNNYLLACHRYVDQNPVRASMTTNPADYPWSSYRCLSGELNHAWLTPSPAYMALGQTAAVRERVYREFVGTRVPEKELSTIRAAIQRNQITGTDSFRQQIEHRIGRPVPANAQGRPTKRK